MPILSNYKIKMGIFLHSVIAALMLVPQPDMAASETVPVAQKTAGKAHGYFFIKADNVSLSSITGALNSEV